MLAGPVLSYSEGRWSLAILGKSEIKISRSNIKKSQVGKRDLSPLLWFRFTYTGVKERSGDKSLFPTF